MLERLSSFFPGTRSEGDEPSEKGALAFELLWKGFKDMSDLHKARDSRAYVLMTAAYNEEAYIGKTIASVISQSLRPSRWII
ncbi:MAG: hypothetical protein DMG76_22430, partial [Acidobacteria bacterium]